MNLLRRSADHARLASVLVCAFAAVLIHGAGHAMGQTLQQPGATPSETKPSQVLAPSPLLTPQEMRRYENVQTLIDWTPEQIRALPELRGLEARESRQDLPAILRAVGEHVDAFFEDFPDTSSTEQVRSGPCDNPSSDRCRVKFRDKFSYLVITNPRGGDQPLGEYRSDAKGRPIDYRRLGNGKVILTYGFTTAPLQHFRPQYQEGCRFRLFGRQSVMGREADVVGFTEIPGRYPQPTEFRRGNAVVPLFLQGIAWIDAKTYQILRIQTYALPPPPGVSLEKETTRIEFSAIPLREATAFWLPTTVVVDVWLDHRHFRNIHTYSNFKLFRVETRIGPAVMN